MRLFLHTLLAVEPQEQNVEADPEKYLGAGEAARRLKALKLRYVSDVLTQGCIPESAFFMTCGRRLIKESALPLILAELQKRGWVKGAANA